MANPKAYIVDDRRNWDSATVVFAESAGQARSLALHTDACEYLDFTDISAKRVPKLDIAYRGVFKRVGGMMKTVWLWSETQISTVTLVISGGRN